MRKVILGLAFVAAVMVSCNDTKKDAPTGEETKIDSVANQVDTTATGIEQTVDSAKAATEGAVDKAVEEGAEKVETTTEKATEAAKK